MFLISVFIFAFVLTPAVSAAPNSFRVVGFDTPVHHEAFNTSAINIILPFTGSSYGSYYKAPTAPNGKKVEIPSFTITLQMNSNCLAITHDKFKVYSGHVTAAPRNIAGKVYSSYGKVIIPINVSDIQSFTINGDIITYKFTVTETQWGKTAYFTVKTEKV